MVARVSEHFTETGAVTSLSDLDDRVRDALLRIERHRFVTATYAGLAYADSALPIGYRQTISQPFIVALMVQLARVCEGMRVLEVGTGSGYQAAVLSEIANEVYSIERVPELAERSKATLEETGHSNVHVRCAGGFEGWPEAAPFDAILVTACAGEIPPPLIDQLAVGGRLVVPVGRPNAYQELQVIEKTRDGEYTLEHGLPVMFVPLVHTESASPPGPGNGRVPLARVVQ